MSSKFSRRPRVQQPPPVCRSDAIPWPRNEDWPHWPGQVALMTPQPGGDPSTGSFCGIIRVDSQTELDFASGAYTNQYGTITVSVQLTPDNAFALIEVKTDPPGLTGSPIGLPPAATRYPAPMNSVTVSTGPQADLTRTQATLRM